MARTRIKICVFILGVLITLPTFIAMRGNAAPTSTDATANGITIDSQNNVIVTGQFYSEAKGKFIIRTEKYDSEGFILWRKDYDKYNYNIGKAITADVNDNIYVAGVVNESILEGFNYLLLKYNKNGKLLWEKAFNSKIYDVPWRIAVDSENHIFVAGMSLKIDITGGIFSSDYWTIKCDLSGNLMESKIEDLSNADLAFGIAIDSNDDVLITGSSNHSGMLKYCTVKYDNNLAVKKGPIYYGPNDENSASGIAIDSTGNIFVTGASGSGGDKDYRTVKYKNDFSSILKEKSYDVADDDDAIAIDIDNNDNVVITGTSNAHFCTIKYDNSLIRQWAITETFIGGARDVAVDSDNNVIVTGYMEDGEKQYYTIKYAPDGTVIWEGGGWEDTSEPPEADFTWNPSNPTRVSGIQFYDRSTGTITTWQWNFGDGTTSNVQQPFHTYTSLGTYDVTLTLSGPKGTDAKTKQITISNAAPISQFIYGPQNPTQGQGITFTDQSTDSDGSIVNWTWNFGDENISYEKNTWHTYTMSGTYTVVLTVKDNDGATKSTQKTITVNPLGANTPPVAKFVYTPSSPSPGNTIEFNAASSYDEDGTIELYRWDWDSNGVYEEEYTTKTATHTWYEEGEYTVTLAVNDNNDMTNTFTLAVSVSKATAGLKISAPEKITLSNGEKTIEIEIECTNRSINDVSLHMINCDPFIINATPKSMSISEGETKKFVVTIKLPSEWNESEKTIKIQATGEGGTTSNTIEAIVTTKAEESPSFTFLVSIIAIALLLLARKRRANKNERNI